MIGANDENPPPGDVRGLAKGLAREMQRFGGKILKTDISLGAELDKVGRRDPTKALGEDGEVDVLRDRLEQDSAEFRRAAMDRYPALFTEASRIVVLIDELGAMSDELLEQLFDHDNGLDNYGLGSALHPVPVVLVVLTDDKPGMRTDLLTGRKSETWLVSRELLEFNENGEDMLAYELVLLNPWRSGGDEQLRQRWIFDRTNGQAGPAGHAKIALEGKAGPFRGRSLRVFRQSWGFPQSAG